MNFRIAGSLALPIALIAMHVAAPAQAQQTISARSCKVITAENEGACCAAENRGVVERFLTDRGRRICNLPRTDREAFFRGPTRTGSLPEQPGVPGSPPVDQPPPGAQPPATGQPPANGRPPRGFTGNPGNEPGVNGPGREVGRAGEDPRSGGFHSEPSGEAHGRSGKSDTSGGSSSSGSKGKNGSAGAKGNNGRGRS